MNEQQYQLRRSDILHRLQRATREAQQRLLSLTERATTELFDLEQEYRGVKPNPSCTCKNTCMACNVDIPLGLPYCLECEERINAVQEANPLYNVNLLDKQWLEKYQRAMQTLKAEQS